MAENEPIRDYVQEAVKILKGESSMLPERRHLAALAKHAEESITNTLLISRLLAVAMLDTGQERLSVPAGALQEATDRGAYLSIEKVKGGHMVITLLFRPQAQSAPAVTVN